MAKLVKYKPYGALQVLEDTTYTGDNVPAEVDVVFLTRGVRITDELGSNTPIRGVRVLVTVTGLTPATTPLPNVPFVWLEGEEMHFDANGSYKFLDKGIVSYGQKVA